MGRAPIYVRGEIGTTVFVRSQIRPSMVEEALYVRQVTSEIISSELSRRETAAYLGMSLKTVDRLRDNGEIDWFEIGAAVRIELASIDAYKERQREARRRKQRGTSGLVQSKFELELNIPALDEARAQRAAA
jgi:excisionase family DNA binding protein